MNSQRRGATSGDGTETVAQPYNDRATRLTVLIIDSRSTNRAVLRMVLETEPGVYVVGEVSTIAAGLQFTESHRPHVIVLDLDLAGANPASTVRQLVAQCPASPVMLLALFVDPMTRGELMSAGAAACVEKDLPGNFLKAFRSVRQRSGFPS